MRNILVFLLKAYQTVCSPFYSPCCRFVPTCSQYAVEAVRVHGCLKGGYLAVHRIFRCRPGGGFGFDPVPSAKSCDPDFCIRPDAKQSLSAKDPITTKSYG